MAYHFPRVKEYIALTERFLKSYQLDDLLSLSIDHFAVKLASTKEYEQFIRDIEPHSEKLTYTILNRRRIANAVLKKAVDFGSFGGTNQLEIMEPKPEKVGKDFVGLDHIEVMCDNLDRVQNILQDKNLKIKPNITCGSIALKLNEEGQEIKFRTWPLMNKILEEYEQGASIRLKWE